jgi:membrane protease YdiL (CAAX protease family)
MPLLLALIVLAWARATHKPWRELGLARPRSWFRAIAGGIVLGASLKLLMKAIVMPLLGADPINREYHFLAGNTAALPAMVLTILVVAGFGEEVFFRGFVFERFENWWGRGTVATGLAILVSAALFGLAHASSPRDGGPGDDRRPGLRRDLRAHALAVDADGGPRDVRPGGGRDHLRWVRREGESDAVPLIV